MEALGTAPRDEFVGRPVRIYCDISADRRRAQAQIATTAHVELLSDDDVMMTPGTLLMLILPAKFGRIEQLLPAMTISRHSPLTSATDVERG
jgi:hypothetical protein